MDNALQNLTQDSSTQTHHQSITRNRVDHNRSTGPLAMSLRGHLLVDRIQHPCHTSLLMIRLVLETEDILAWCILLQNSFHRWLRRIWGCLPRLLSATVVLLQSAFRQLLRNQLFNFFLGLFACFRYLQTEFRSTGSASVTGSMGQGKNSTVVICVCVVCHILWEAKMKKEA